MIKGEVVHEVIRARLLLSALLMIYRNLRFNISGLVA